MDAQVIGSRRDGPWDRPVGPDGRDREPRGPDPGRHGGDRPAGPGPVPDGPRVGPAGPRRGERVVTFLAGASPQLGQIDADIRATLKRGGQSDYAPDYDVTNDQLTVNAVRQPGLGG